MNLTARKIYSVILLTAMLCGLFSTVFLADFLHYNFNGFFAAFSDFRINIFESLLMSCKSSS